MKYRGLSINYAGMGVDMKVDMGLEVFVSRVSSVPSALLSGVAGISRYVHVHIHVALSGNNLAVVVELCVQAALSRVCWHCFATRFPLLVCVADFDTETDAAGFGRRDGRCHASGVATRQYSSRIA